MIRLLNLFLKCRSANDADHTDFAQSQHLGSELANSSPKTSAKRAADTQGRYKRAVRRRLLDFYAAAPEPRSEMTPENEGDKRDEEGDKQDECDALRSMNMQL